MHKVILESNATRILQHHVSIPTSGSPLSPVYSQERGHGGEGRTWAGSKRPFRLSERQTERTHQLGHRIEWSLSNLASSANLEDACSCLAPEQHFCNIAFVRVMIRDVMYTTALTAYPKSRVRICSTLSWPGNSR